MKVYKFKRLSSSIVVWRGDPRIPGQPEVERRPLPRRHHPHGVDVLLPRAEHDEPVPPRRDCLPPADRIHKMQLPAGEVDAVAVGQVQHRADVVYAPTDETLCPEGRENAPQLQMTLPLSDLENDPAALIAHLKNINTIQPDLMVWGERNFIEYAQVRRMIDTLALRTQLHCMPTVRHADGRAVSGTDELLNVQQERVVPVIYQTLQNVAHVIRSGGRNYQNIRRTARTALQGAGFEIQYFTILDEQTLAEPADETRSFRFVCRVTLDGIPMVDGMSLKL